MGEVRYRFLTGGIDKHVYLEVIFVIGFVSFVNLVGAKTERIRIANMLLFIYSFVVVFVCNSGIIVIGNGPIAWVIGQILG